MSQRVRPVPHKWWAFIHSNLVLYRLLSLESIINQIGLNSQKGVIAAVGKEHDLGHGQTSEQKMDCQIY